MFHLLFSIICCILVWTLAATAFLEDYKHASRHLTSITSQWSGVWTTNKAVFLALADSKYFYFVTNLVDSLVSLDYSTDDVVVACVSQECMQKCDSLGYRCHFGGTPCAKHITWATHSRCLVSSVKIDSTLSLLSLGYVVITLDLDVFLQKDPLAAFIPEARYPLVSMFDGPEGLNFGLFMIRPCNLTVEMFTWMKQEFTNTGYFDQYLYNKFVTMNNVAVQRLDNDLFVNYMTVRSTYLAMPHVNHTANAAAVIHTTCVEGAFTKFFIARTVCGRIYNKKFYSGLPTVSSFMHPNWTMYEKASFIDVLVNISRQTNRWIRVLGGTGDILASTFSADKLARQGIVLVEESYWDSVTEFNSSFIPSKTVVNVVPATALSSLKSIHTDDLVVDISPSSLDMDPTWKWDVHRPLKQSWLCTLFSERKGNYLTNGCLMQCDGKHF